MTTYDVQSVRIRTPRDRAFGFIAEPRNLPAWAGAFKSADDRSADLATPMGAVRIELVTHADFATGAVDWTMKFPDGAVGHAFSRVTPDGADAAIYSFVLMAPPVPLEQIEGALAAQKVQLAAELIRLKTLLEG